MRKKIIALFTAITLAFGTITVSPIIKTVDASTTSSVEDKEFACVCEAAEQDSEYLVTYGSKNVEELSADKITEENLPNGYTKDVIKVSNPTNGSGIGLLLDFSEERILYTDVASITFRVCVKGTANPTDNYPEMRIQKPYMNGSWVLRQKIASKINEWVDVTISSNGDGFLDNSTMAEISKDGYLDKFNLLVRYDNLKEFYIDSIKVTLNESEKEDDGIDDFDAECLAVAPETGDKPLVTYGAKKVEKLTYDQAIAAGVPSGFSKNVVKVSETYNTAAIGALIDFSGKKIPQNIVKSITFRVYVGKDADGTYPEVRIHRPGYQSGDFITRTSIASNVKKWTDVTIDSDGTNIYGNASITDMCSDGYLNKCNLIVRVNNVEEFYIDSIKVVLKDNDYTGPVITCDDTLYFSSKLMPTVTAHDEMEDRDVNVEYIWPEGTVLDENNLPPIGNYEVTIRAKDYFGNITEKKVNAVIIANDETKPEITVQSEEVYAITGMIPILSATATDDSGVQPTITYEWSKDALDSKGGLTKGNHTWTIKATDGSGNIATKEVRVYVSDEEYFGEEVNVIDEGITYGNDSDHNMIFKAAKSPTCTKDGNIAYYYCSDCGKYFADEAGNKELSKDEITIKATGHKEVVVKGKAATTEKTGLTDGSKCSVCGTVIKAQKTIAKIAKPKATKLTKVTKGKKKVTVKFKKIKNVSGYELCIARNSKMNKNMKKYKIKSSKTSYTVKKLKAKTNYWVRIRTYKKVSNTTAYSNWSKSVKVKTK